MSKDEMNGNETLKNAFSGSGGRAAPTAGCPGDETIWAAARGQLPPGRVQEILAHSLDCADCEESFRMAAGMMAEMREAETVAPSQVYLFPRRRFVFAFGAIAATILIVVALPALLRLGGAPPQRASLGAAVVTTLWRVSPDGDRPLADGDAIRPGDRLYMTVESDEPVHLYVINRDDAGESSALFPIEGAQWSNPLQPGIARRIPGETTSDYDSWQVSSAGGRDSFIVVASRDPIPRLQAALDRIAAATPLDSDEYVRGGESGPADTPRENVDGRIALDNLLKELGDSSASGDPDLVLRRTVLDNPR